MREKKYVSRSDNIVKEKEMFSKNPFDIELFGIGIHNQTMTQAVGWATTLYRSPQTAAFVNVNSINLGANQASLKKHINQCDRVFADGVGVRIGARHLGFDIQENVNGTDLLEPLCEQAAILGRRIFLLGGEVGLADKAASRLLSRYPFLQIAGFNDGYFDKNSMENQSVIDDINASNTDILLVGLGSPIQERWIAENRTKLRVSTVLAVGGLIDFVSGRIPRAPKWMRSVSAEWLWRLMQEPATKFNRYVIGNPVYLARLYLRKKSKHKIASNDIASTRHRGLSAIFQRTAALLGLIAICPLLMVFSTLVKFTSKGPVFYSQVRVGKHGRRFRFYKFGSMYIASDPRFVDTSNIESDREGVCKKYVNDPRVTSIGGFMRKYSIDELPQLVNVVLGDMLLIGPRPALTQEVDSYQHKMYERFDVLPGLTGLWQVSGRANTTFEEQIDLDLRYVAAQSWWQDIRILASTLPAVVFARGAY